MAEIVTKRCEHMLKFEGMAHGHVLVLDRDTQYVMCEGCYAEMYQRLFSDQMPKTWLGNPLIEPAPETWKDRVMVEFRRQDPY